MRIDAAAELMAHVLELDLVGADDNFFELGGNSLLALILIEEIKGQGESLGLIEFFRNPTPRTFAIKCVADK